MKIEVDMPANRVFAFACLLIALVVAASGRDGWGWLVFVAVVAF